MSQEPCATSLVSVHDPVQPAAHQPAVLHQPLPSLPSPQNSWPRSIVRPGQTAHESEEIQVLKQ